jgi:Asp/Glu/hydantoin racemase
MANKKIVTIVQTSLVSHQYLNELFTKIIPEAEVHNIVDDSLLKEVSSHGSVTPGIVNRLCKYFDAAASLGSDLIFNQCSSVGEAAAIAAKTVGVPVLRVDEAMAEKAVELGKKIGVVATVASTVSPSCNLVKAKAEAAGKTVEVTPYLVDGAMHVLMKEGREKHNALVKQTVVECARNCDVVVLAQGSMVVLVPELADITKPVLSSPESGVQKARTILFGK